MPKITCMQKPVKGKQRRGEQGAWEKSLNGHEDHRYANTRMIMYLQYEMWYNMIEGARIYGAQ